MKKKVLAITMAALMAASLTACGGSAKETTAADTAAAATAEEKRIPRQPRVRMRPAQRQLRLGQLRRRQAADLSWRPTQSSLLTSIMTEMPS